MPKYRLNLPYSTDVCIEYGPPIPPNTTNSCTKSEHVSLVKGDVISATALPTNGDIFFTYKNTLIQIPSISIEKVDDSTPTTFPIEVIPTPLPTPTPTPTPSPINNTQPMTTNTKKWILIIVSVLIIIGIWRAQWSTMAKIIYTVIYALIGGYVYKQILYPDTRSY